MRLSFHLFKKREISAAEAMAAADFHFKAHRDWKILLLSATFLALIIFALDGYLLWRVNYGDIFTSAPVVENSAPANDKKTLSNTVKFFDDRASAYETWKKTPPAEIDPSL